ncbi:DUF6210 family protein [uncultured Aquimarina sp.]|uniref:DUF6210 family protein n=1 Tax=uncultured Aquimarina sp. TaxID=575652 RepID=UPI002638DBBC|nr:DUF6210 family protein [uncultured Aquimarina sp.]
MNIPQIEIWDSVGLGIIIEYPTGIIISNQTGGTACVRTKIEGVFLPLANDYHEETKEFLSPEIKLSDYFKGEKYKGNGAIKGIDLEDVQNINEILNKTGLDKLIEIDVERLKESHEAWIHIKINDNNDFGLISGFDNYPLKGVLTWSNSD